MERQLLRVSLLTSLSQACWLRIKTTKQADHKTCGCVGTRIHSSSLSASAPCLCMPGSVGILPPTAGSCSASLAHMSTPHNPHTLCMVCVSSPPTYPPTLGSAAPFLFCFVFSSADQNVAQPLDGRERDEWSGRSPTRRTPRVSDARLPPLVEVL